jgi:hypothetical protein
MFSVPLEYIIGSPAMNGVKECRNLENNQHPQQQ